MISLFIPGEPEAKGRPKFTQRGSFVQAYTPAKTRLAEKQVASFARAAMMGCSAEMLKGPIKVQFSAYMPVRESWSNKRKLRAYSQQDKHVSRPDLDNLLKLVLDACNGIVFKDDSQIVEIHAFKCYVSANGEVGTQVRFTEVEQSNDLFAEEL